MQNLIQDIIYKLLKTELQKELCKCLHDSFNLVFLSEVYFIAHHLLFQKTHYIHNNQAAHQRHQQQPHTHHHQ